MIMFEFNELWDATYVVEKVGGKSMQFAVTAGKVPARGLAGMLEGMAKAVVKPGRQFQTWADYIKDFANFLGGTVYTLRNIRNGAWYERVLGITEIALNTATKLSFYFSKNQELQEWLSEFNVVSIKGDAVSLLTRMLLVDRPIQEAHQFRYMGNSWSLYEYYLSAESKLRVYFLQQDNEDRQAGAKQPNPIISAPAFVINGTQPQLIEELSPKVWTLFQHNRVVWKFPEPKDRDQPKVRDDEFQEQLLLSHPFVYPDLGHIGDYIGDVDCVKLATKLALHRQHNHPRSLMFYGPPGTGKSTVARRLIQCDTSRQLRFIPTPTDFGKLSILPELLAILKPEIVILDDLDQYAGDQYNGALSDLPRILEAMRETFPNVSFISTINRIDVFRPSDVRPGRIDEIVEFALPTLEQRVLILELYNKDNGNPLSQEDITKVAEMTEGFSPADLKEFCIRWSVDLKIEGELDFEHAIEVERRLRPRMGNIGETTFGGFHQLRELRDGLNQANLTMMEEELRHAG